MQCVTNPVDLSERNPGMDEETDDRTGKKTE